MTHPWTTSPRLTGRRSNPRRKLCRGYALSVPTILALRKRLPLVVFLLLFVLILMMIGVACACLAGQPMQALERGLGGSPAIGPPLIELWALLTVLLFPALLVVAQRPAATGRASPAALQRFLF